MDDFKINDVIATELSIQKKNSSLFVLTNYGFHRVKYRDDFNQLSIETRQDMLSRLTKSFNDTVIQKHITAKHDIEDRMYFQTIAKKVNQFDDSFEIFNFIPTEFRET